MTVQITLKKSLIGRRPQQVATAHALGLKRIGQTVTKEQNDAIQQWQRKPSKWTK